METKKLPRTGKTTRRIVIGNWKMNPLALKEAQKIFTTIAKSTKGIKKTDVVLCSPFIYLEGLKKISKKTSLGAQDAYYGDTGAFTGEVSAAQLATIGVKYVIVGHSERRARGESNEETNKKIKAVLAAGLVPVLCVGEVERDEKHEYYNLIKTQIGEALNGVSKTLIPKIIIAYEPVWALSTTENRRDATSSDSLEMSIFIKKVLADKFGSESSAMRILYGGSVNEKDAGDFIINGGVDGLLVGRASLDPKKFSEIISICETLSR